MSVAGGGDSHRRLMRPRLDAAVRRLAVRVLPAAAYAGLAVAVFVREGIPIAADRLIAWLVGALLCFCLVVGSDRWRTLLRDWLPLAVALTLYNVLTGVGTGRAPIHSEAQIWISRRLFGSVPGVWLQARLWNPAHLHWYDYASWAVYMSFFVATPTILAVLWFRRPAAFTRYVILLVGVWFMSLVMFTAVPTRPPWLASSKGMIGPVTRIVEPIGAHVPIFDTTNLWERGLRLANDLAAFPSVHEAMTLLIAVFFWRRARRPVRVLLALYPLAMAFALVYAGEHYVVDLLGGAGLTVTVVVAERVVSARLRARQLRPVAVSARR